MTSTTPDEIVEAIEAAEEAKDVDKVVEFVGLVSSNVHAGEEDWAEAAEAALDALFRLVKGGNADTDDSLIYLNAVLESLDAWEEEEAIVEVGLGCVVAIATKANSNSTDNKEETKTENDDEDGPAVPIGLVFDSMKAFKDEATIQEQSCLAIEGLALWKNPWKDELAATEGMKDELVAARDERITNERNKAYPVRAAKALGIDLE